MSIKFPNKITISGYKSIAEPVSFEIGNLTILAGANSAGKSSLIQPLLLFKQTLEASYQPAGLKLDGPMVHFTEARQFLSSRGKAYNDLVVRFDFSDVRWVSTCFKYDAKLGLRLNSSSRNNGDSLEVWSPTAKVTLPEKMQLFDLKKYPKLRVGVIPARSAWAIEIDLRGD